MNLNTGCVLAVCGMLLRAGTGLAQSPAPLVVPAYAFSGQGNGEVALREAADLVPAYIHFWYTPGHWVEWRVGAPAEGAYRLSARAGCLYPTRRKVEVNGRTVPGLESYEFGPTHGWTDFTEVTLPGTVSLKKGENTLRITCLDDASLCLAGLTLTSQKAKVVLSVDPLAYTAEGGGAVQKVVGNSSGFFTMWDEKGHALEWKMVLPVAGEYRMAVRYAALHQAAREIQVNGAVVPGCESVVFKRSGGWRFWVEQEVPVPLRLKKGENTVRMTNLQGSMNLTALVLRAPDGKETLIPAVAFVSQSGGKVTVYGVPKHKVVYRWDRAGHYLEWTVEAPKAGLYDMTVRYATKVQATREVRVNGEVVKGLESVQFGKRTSFDDWAEYTLPAPVPLKAGSNAVRMTNVAGSMNLDELRFTMR